VLIPQEYILQKFYQYAGTPKFKRFSNTYTAGCPVCHEGKSWGKKRRCIYMVDKNAICCHNCGWYSNPTKWIQEVSGLTFNEIIQEAQNYDIIPVDILSTDETPKPKRQIESLPTDSINLFDANQVNYFKDNKVVNDAIELVKKRKIDVAINRPEAMYVSLKDQTHKNRIIIPFYNEDNEVIFYQSRLIYKQDMRLYPKYLSKINGEKSLYNINKISADLDFIFIFEGPIDSFFVKNGTAVAGIQENSNTNFTSLQETQLAPFKFHKKIWVLDNQWLDDASRKKTQKLIDSGETVFIWPESFSKSYKDVNEICEAKNLSEMEPSFFADNSYTGLKARLVMSSITR
jgi:hypothetical protein